MRTWKAPTAGQIRVTGNARKADDAGAGDGVRVAVYKNGTQVWPASGWNTIGAADFTGVSHDLTLTVAANDLVRFVVNRNSTNVNDATSWDPLVQYDTYSASSGFSSTQGANRWSYSAWNGTSFTPMTWDAANSRWKGAATYTLVGSNWQHPDTTDSARIWTAPSTGTVRLTGTAALQYGTAGDGVRIKILKNGVQVWPSSGWKSIAYNDTSGIAHDLALPVTTGDTVAFVVNRNGTNTSDATLGTRWCGTRRPEKRRPTRPPGIRASAPSTESVLALDGEVRAADGAGELRPLAGELEARRQLLGCSMSSESLKPTARLPASSSVYSRLTDRPLS